MRRLRLVPLLICLAIVALATGAAFADPPTTPVPPSGYVYGEQTVNTSLTQSIGSNLISDPGFDLGWWTLESGWSIGGGVATHVTGASSAFYQSNALVTNDFYEVQFDIASTSGGGCVQLFLGVGGSATNCYGSPATYQSLIRFTTAVEIAGIGASYDFHGSVDNIAVRPITRAATHTATADGTHQLNFSLPTSPLAGQQIELRYRMVDNQNYMAVRLQRNSSNTTWDMSLIRVTDSYIAVQISQSNVGSVTALRVMSVEDYHYIYAGIGGSFTYFWTINDASHNTATSVTGVWNDAFSVSSLSSWSIVDESSITPTPGATPSITPTPDIVVYGSINGQTVRFVYSMTAADQARIVLLAAILFSLWVLTLIVLFVAARMKK